MAEKDSSDKTEQPTPKRLQDARKKGDVAKSRDVGLAASTLMWAVLITATSSIIGPALADLASRSVGLATAMPFDAALAEIATRSGWLVVQAAFLCLLPAALLGMAAEYFQIGAIFTTEKLKFKFDNLNIMNGFKRMIGLDSLVEIAKSTVKAIVLGCIAAYFVVAAARQGRGFVTPAAWDVDGSGGPQIATLLFAVVRDESVLLLGTTGAIFAFVAAADWFYSRHRFLKKMRMSRRDIKNEYKDSEGDPQLKSQRRSLHQEWASQNNIGAAGQAHALLVNPTHLAIALAYDGEETPVPVISGKGEGETAAAMRAAAEQANVPIIRHVATARRLWSRGEIGEIVPEEMFDAIAEIILWAERARRGEIAMFQERG